MYRETMVTMKDVAKKAGVSRTTISLVLNNRHTAVRISDKTRRRIEETVGRMNYHRNEIARAMITGKTKVIGFLCQSINQEYTASILGGVMEEAAQHGYFIKFFPIGGLNNFKITVKQCLGYRVAGVIGRSLPEEALNYLHDECSRNQIPVAVVGSSFSHPWGIRVISDDRQGAYLAVEHLAGLGHRRIAHISLNVVGGYATLRKEGYLAAMEHFGLEVPEDYLVLGKDLTKIERLSEKMLSGRDNGPTAVFCGTDLIAMVVLRTAHRLGLRIPKDLSVVGFANLSMAELSDPSLTTVEEPFAEMGRVTAKRLIQEIELQSKKSLQKQTEEIIPVRLIVRESTGPSN